ncbi:MAG TPA: hypothetical protein VLA34_12735, partial [Candidatus Krumholzibacterium sp.]|nr:hypothetical protein [Candidatus Krumholzibacterium sp.]
VEIAGEGTFEVITVDGPNQLTLDGPLTNTATNVSYSITSRYMIWSAVASVANNSALAFSSAFPGTTGTYKLLLINNYYFQAYYDQFEELCPDERLGFVLTLRPDYAGALPVFADLPDTQTTTVTLQFDAPGDSHTSVLTEPTP